MNDFNTACAFIDPYFHIIVAKMEEEMKAKVFTVEDDKYQEMKAQYKFLQTLAQRIKNEADAAKGDK